MNFDNLLDRLIPMFEKTIAFRMTMMERALSLQEKKEANDAEFKYKELEAKVTGEKDKLAWDKEKTAMVIASDLNLEREKNIGLLANTFIKGQTERDVAETNARATVLSAQLGRDSSITGKRIELYGNLAAASATKETIDSEGKVTGRVAPSKETMDAFQAVGSELGYNRANVSPTAGPAGNATPQRVVTTADTQNATRLGQKFAELEKAGKLDEATALLDANKGIANDILQAGKAYKMNNPPNANQGAAAPSVVAPAVGAGGEITNPQGANIPKVASTDYRNVATTTENTIPSTVAAIRPNIITEQKLPTLSGLGAALGAGDGGLGNITPTAIPTTGALTAEKNYRQTVEDQRKKKADDEFMKRIKGLHSVR